VNDSQVYFLGRNIELTIKVLEGLTLYQAAKEYNVTPERIRQITYKTCRMYLLQPKGVFRNKTLDNVRLKTLRRFWREGILKKQ
jgi:hypothetical protein